MREIKFRGKIRDSEEWVTGYFYKGKKLCLITSGGRDVIVVPDSVGQFSGMTDINGVEIFEGDILKLNKNENDLSNVCYGEFGVIDLETQGVVDSVTGWYTVPAPDSPLANVEPFCLPLPLNKFYISHSKAEVVGNVFDGKTNK